EHRADDAGGDGRHRTTGRIAVPARPPVTIAAIAIAIIAAVAITPVAVGVALVAARGGGFVATLAAVLVGSRAIATIKHRIHAQDARIVVIRLLLRGVAVVVAVVAVGGLGSCSRAGDGQADGKQGDRQALHGGSSMP